MVSFHISDIIILLVFFSLLLGIVLFFAGRKKQDDYQFGGSKLTLLPFIMTNVATWYGGILGVGEFTYRYGISSWFTQGLPYYLFAFLFAFFFASKIKQHSSLTIPQMITEHFGVLTGKVSAVIVFLLVSPAPYLLMCAKIITVVFQIPLWTGLIISAGLCLIYLIPFGFKSDIIADMFLFVVMFIGFIIIILTGYFQLGGWDYLVTNLPAEHLTLTGGLPYTVIIVWWLIGFWTFIDPGFFQRTKAAASSSIAKKGIIISILFWILFDFLTTTTGLYAKALVTDLKDGSQSYLILAERLLSSGWKGIFYAALLATILSTLNSFLFLSGVTFSNDILNKKTNETEEIRSIRIGMILSSLLAIVICINIPSVIEIWFTIGSYFVPGVIYLMIVVVSQSFGIKKEFSLPLIIIPTVFSIGWDLLRRFETLPEKLAVIEPMLIGLAVGGIIVLVAKQKTPERVSGV